MNRFPVQSRASSRVAGFTLAAGFTLIETLMVLVIAAILVSLAAPSFLSTIRDNRVLTYTNHVAAAVGSARAEAVKRGRRVAVCPSSDGATCGTDWSGGWLVYVEKTTVSTGASPDIDTVLSVGGSSEATVTSKTGGANNWVRFDSRGMAEESTTLEVKPDTCATGTRYQEMVINIVGRVSFSKKTCT